LGGEGFGLVVAELAGAGAVVTGTFFCGVRLILPPCCLALPFQGQGVLLAVAG
jgi:hypothetical protein